MIDAYAAAALIASLGIFAVSMSIAAWWFSRALTALAAGALNVRQVLAADGVVTETDPVAASEPDPVAPTPRLNTRNRLRDLTDAQMRAALDEAKVITFDDNNGIEGDVPPIPHPRRGVPA